MLRGKGGRVDENWEAGGDDNRCCERANEGTKEENDQAGHLYVFVAPELIASAV